MERKLSDLAVRSGEIGWKVIVAVLAGAWRIATSQQVKNAVRTGVQGAWKGVVFVVIGIASLIGRQYPTLRKAVRTGIIGGWRYFRGVFNRGRSDMMRSTRNLLSPIEWVCTGGSVLVAVFNPVLGIALFVTTYIVFFKDPDRIPLASFSADSAGVNGVIGVGTALLVNLFVLFSAVRATGKWLQSQF